VAEWFKAAVLKTAVVKATGGSNPSSSANEVVHDFVSNTLHAIDGAGAVFESLARHR
jgi:hypothetical protein